MTKTDFQHRANHVPDNIDSVRETFLSRPFVTEFIKSDTVYPYKTTTDRLSEVAGTLFKIIDSESMFGYDITDPRRDQLFLSIHQLAVDLRKLSQQYGTMTLEMPVDAHEKAGDWRS